MATLNELNSRLQSLKLNLGTYEEAKEKVVEELKASKANVKDLNKEIRDLDKTIGSFDIVISTQTDPAQKAELENQRNALQAELEEKTAERDRIIELGKVKQEAEAQIEQANTEIQDVIAEFASDPRINAHLQEAIEIKYDEQIELKEQEKAKKQNLAEKFSLELQNDDVFGVLVADLAEKHAELKRLNEQSLFIVDEDDRKKAANVRAAFTKSYNKLKSAIASRPEYEGIVLTAEDFETIVEGSNSEGKYEIPAFVESIAVVDKTIADLEGRKVKSIEKVKSALVPEKVNEEELSKIDQEIAKQDGIYQESEEEEKMFSDEVVRLEEEIEKLKATFVVPDTRVEEESLEEARKALEDIESEMKLKNDKIDELQKQMEDLDKEFSDLKFDRVKYDELTEKADIPDELKIGKEDAQQEYDDALKALKDKGYIHPKVYPAIETEECQKAFAEFKDADYAVRKAFLDCRTDDSAEAKESLKKAMENYSKISDNLLKIDGMEGLTVENWHDYLVRGLQEDAKKGQIDEVYYDDTFKNRLKGLEDEYAHVEGVDDNFLVIGEANDKLSELQESFLKGEKVDFDKDVTVGLTNYVDAMGGLFKTLKDKGEAGLENVSDLFKKLGAKIAESRVGKWLSRAKDWAARKLGIGRKEVSGAKPKEESELNDILLDELEDKEEALTEAEIAIEKHLEGKLTPEETQELYEQEEKLKKGKELLKERKAKSTQKDALSSEVAELLPKQTDAIKLVNEKFKDLEEAKAKGTGTPEEQAKLAELEKQRDDAAETAYKAGQRKLFAQKEKEDLEKAKSELKPSRPSEVVSDSRKIAHGRGNEIKEAAIEAFTREDDR